MQRFHMTVAAYLILIEDGKILLQRRCNTGYADGMYSFVAGHLDGGETVQQAICREAMEEGRVTVLEEDIDIVHVMHRRGDDLKERIDYFCTAQKWDGEPAIGEPDKCDDLSWFDVHHLPPNTIPYIVKALEFYKSNIPFSSYGFKDEER